MAIEGPLRELGIHDVFQLLDLSRKTGLLRVSSELRNDEGTVYFDGGRVVHASIRSLGARPEVALLQAGRITEADIQWAQQRQAKGRVGVDLPDLLVEVGAISAKELERQLRLQIESVVFDLMSWKEGFFSFEERSRDEMPRDRRITVSTESLLMEGARRIDEWSRIAETIPNVNVVPELAPVDDNRDGAMLDLLPHEWQVLTMIDGERDLRDIAAALGRDEFEIAKIAYGLATTGVIVAHARRVSVEMAAPAMAPSNGTGDRARGHLDAGVLAARAGDLATARVNWEQFLRLAPADQSTARVQTALEAAIRLHQFLEGNGNGA
jgi:hypothetical protein